MKNREFHKLLNKNKSKSNSGFTLTELLVGLIMGTIVIGGLGFGLVNLLRNTQTQTAFSEIRNDSSRALDFVSDEVRRAQSLTTTATGFTPATGQEVVLALDIPDLANDIVYYLQPNTGSNWEGPLVLYRWGPPLNATGEYTGGTWQAEALIDGIDDTTLAANACNTAPITAANPTNGGQIVSPAAPTGFYACIQDDDRDSNFGEAEDTDSSGIAAQLFLTSAVDIGRTNNETYTANTQVVARARTAPANRSEVLNPDIVAYRRIGDGFGCNPPSKWRMRTDFGENLGDPDSLASWNPDPQKRRESQPVRVSNDTLSISSIPRSASNCLNSRANNGRESTNPTDPRDFSGNETLGENEDWTTNDDVVAISHVINFDDPRTFNGDPTTCTSYPCANAYSANNGKVLTDKTGTASTENPHVLMLKYGSEIPNYGGYDANNNGVIEPGDQPSLGEFLYNQVPSLADRTGSPGNYTYTVNNKIKPNERIITFELGHTDLSSTNPGADFQDNVLILSSDAFKKKHDSYDDGNGNTGSYPL